MTLVIGIQKFCLLYFVIGNMFASKKKESGGVLPQTLLVKRIFSDLKVIKAIVLFAVFKALLLYLGCGCAPRRNPF